MVNRKKAGPGPAANKGGPAEPGGVSLSVNIQGSAALKEKKGRKSKYALRKQVAKAASSSDAPSQKSGQPAVSEAPKKKRPRERPSEASGGVPEPTMAYFLQAQKPPSQLPEPRQILVVLDLNGTLLYRPNKRQPTKFIERPHAKDFMDYCLDTFTVAIWSSARPDNVNHMVAQLLTPEQRAKCVVVWARDKFGLDQADYDGRVQCYKRLSRIWADPEIQKSHPDADQGGRWDQSNTVLVDDSLEKARSEPCNLLEIPDFVGLAGEPPHVLPQVHDYLNNLCRQSDISQFVRQNRFMLDPSYKLQGDAD